MRCRELHIFKILGIFREIAWNFPVFWRELVKNFFGNLLEDFFGGIFLEEFFGRNFLGGFFWKEFFLEDFLFTLLKSAMLFEYGRNGFVC